MDRFKPDSLPGYCVYCPVLGALRPNLLEKGKLLTPRRYTNVSEGKVIYTTKRELKQLRVTEHEIEMLPAIARRREQDEQIDICRELTYIVTWGI